MPLPAPPQLRSPFARAVVPVATGIVLMGVLALALWAVAALISNGSAKSTDLFSSRTFTPGPAASYAAIVAEDGPIIFPDLLGTDGDKTIVLDHAGTDPNRGWVIRLAHPADKPISCKVTQVRRTRNFTDCDGRVIPAEQLAPPAAGIAPDVSTDGILSLDLIADGAATTPPSVTNPP